VIYKDYNIGKNILMDNDTLKRHPYDLHAKQIEIPIEDIARHIRAFDRDETESETGVPLETMFKELSYDENQIEADLEYLTTAGFIDRELEEGTRTYSLTEEAETYLEEFLGRTSDYTEMVDETLRGEI
jgi:DNA-binding transcriptional ArsR family regulator